MACKLIGLLNGIREVEGVTEQGPRKGEKWQFLSMEITDTSTGHVWSCQMRADNDQYAQLVDGALKGHKVKVTITSQSAAERTLKDGRKVMQIRSQVGKLEDLGLPTDDDE